MTDQIKKALQELLNLGFTEKNLLMYLSLIYEDFVDEMEDDMVKLEPKEFNELENAFKSVSLKDVFETKKNLQFMVLLKKLYGLNGETKFNEFVLKELEFAIEDIKRMREEFKNVDPNSPEFKAKLEQASQNPDFKTISQVVQRISSDN